MSDKAYMKHVQTGEVFEMRLGTPPLCRAVWDKNGEEHVFIDDRLTPYDPEEAWEDVPSGHVGQGNNGLFVAVVDAGGVSFSGVPSERTRTITRDGKLVVQRRKS